MWRLLSPRLSVCGEGVSFVVGEAMSMSVALQKLLRSWIERSRVSFDPTF
jgi:hypothetical protein